MISSLCKNLTVSIIVTSLLIPSVLLLYPYRVEAQSANCASVLAGVIATMTSAGLASKITGVPVADIGAELGTGSTAGTNYGTFFKTCILTPIAIQLGKAMLRNLTESIVKWINSGFKGNPSFVQDFAGMLSDSADQAIGSFIQHDLGGAFLCNSFSLQVKVDMAQTYLPYNQKSSCTLSSIQKNLNNFVKNNGGVGWDNWLAITTVPQNNVYGATVIAQGELAKQIADKLNVQKTTLDWGKGFRSWDVCTWLKDDSGATFDNNGLFHPTDPSTVSPTDPNCASTKTQTPGGVVESQLEN